MSSAIDVTLELEVAEFYRSLGIVQGPGDVQYRLIVLVLAKNGVGRLTKFSDIREYTDELTDRGNIGSKMKTVFQLDGLVKRVGRGEYVLTEKGAIAAEFIKKTSKYYHDTKLTQKIVDRFP